MYSTSVGACLDAIEIRSACGRRMLSMSNHVIIEYHALSPTGRTTPSGVLHELTMREDAGVRGDFVSTGALEEMTLAGA